MAKPRLKWSFQINSDSTLFNVRYIDYTIWPPAGVDLFELRVAVRAPIPSDPWFRISKARYIDDGRYINMSNETKRQWRGHSAEDVLNQMLAWHEERVLTPMQLLSIGLQKNPKKQQYILAKGVKLAMEKNLTRMTLPAGEYYVVDPSYVMGDVHQDFVGDFIKIRNAKVFTEGEHKFLVLTDFGGDGTYDGVIDTQGKRTRKISIGVDSGMVSLIPVKFVKEIGAKVLGGRHPKVKFVKPAKIYLQKKKGMTSTVEIVDGSSNVFIGFGL
jgi:hypothetical protein